MKRNLAAYTAPPPEAYPGYVSINRDESGDIEVTVRAAPTVVDGAPVCGQTSAFTVPAADWDALLASLNTLERTTP